MISGLSENEWNEIFRNETAKSYALFKAVEYSKLDDVQHYYLKITSETETLSIVPCFTCKLDLCVLLDKKTQKFVNRIRKMWKSFLFLDIFGVGSLIATCEQHFGIHPQISDEQFIEMKNHLNDEIKTQAKETKSSIISVKEAPANELNKIKNVLNSDFVFYYSLPNTFVPAGKAYQPCPKALVHRSQKRYTKFVNEFNELGLHREIHDDFSHLAHVMFQFYTEVYHRSKNKFDKLNLSFFEQINKWLPDKSCIALSRTPSGEIAGMMLVVEEENRLVPLYLGLNYNIPKYRTVYFNTLFKTVSEAERKNKGVCVLGQTSYYPKILTGCLMQSLYLGFYSQNIIVKLCITHLFKYLFPETKPPCHYKYREKQDVMNCITENNLQIDF